MAALGRAENTKAFYDQGFWRGDTIYELARDHAAKWPEKTAVRERHRAVTYAQLLDAADRFAGTLARAGLEPSDRVAVWLPNRAETAAALLACSRNGYVCCPSLHRAHRAGEIVELLDRMRAAALIAEAEYGADGAEEDIFKDAAGIASLKYIHRVEPITDRDAGLLPHLTVRPERADVLTDPDSVVYLAFTSGSTGRPKGVLHSDNTLLANARALATDWALDTDMIVYSLSPLSHNLGWGAMIMTLTGGGTFIVQDLDRGDSLLERISATGATFLFGVPTHAIDLLAELRAAGSGAETINGFRISGASIPHEIAASLLEHGITPQSGYGMTEAGSHHYTLPSDEPQMIIQTSGRAAPGYKVKIFSIEDPDKELPAGETGEIGGRGASLMLGYFDDPEEYRSAFNSSGWFMTGDLGWVDEDGFIRITGRKKDVIIRGGHNINPVHIETLAVRHALVERAAVIPVSDERLGEKACIVLQLKGGATLKVDELLAYLDDCKLSKYDMPEYFLVLDTIPLTPSGKLHKRELVAWVEDGQIKPMPSHFRSGAR
ncbi:MAG: class I adenylate-forming enzyme family protein [Pseudomonadota bacterium]|nr:class I adenylate-forming enzyme family protein [Pseudomonadota bacterium]